MEAVTVAPFMRLEITVTTADRSNYRSFYPSSSFGLSIGVGGYSGFGYGYGYSGFGYPDPYRFDGYGYDPYRYGSFRMPDLLDDPYFIERNRYRPPLVIRPAVPAATYPSYGGQATYESGFAAQAVAVDPADLASQLRSASEELSRSLLARRDGDAWMAYLAPHRIIELTTSGNSAELRELLTHYDGVVGNPQMGSVAAASGFVATRNLLRQYVSQSTEVIQPRRQAAGERATSDSRLVWLDGRLVDRQTVRPHREPVR